ncbi:hypothetical protein KDL45_14630, partial [bacterium]|nr:hypothetical protein [bacterium]
KTYDWELREPELTIPLPGRWSRNELYLSQFMNYLWEAFVNFVLAQNLDINTVTFDQFTYRGSTCEVMLRDFLTSIKNTVYDPIFPNAFTLIEPYDKSVEQMRLTAVSLGNMFGAIANMAGEMLADSDNQDGRANGYRDLNRNFRFDRDEYWTFSDTGFGFTFDGMVALQKLGYAMEENLKGGDPVETALFLPVIENVIQNGDERLIPEEAGPIIETLVPLLLKRKYVDFSYPFYNATPDGFRPAVLQLIGFLEDLKANAANLPESWECNDLDPFS